MDRDGKPELATANQTENTVSVLQNSFISVTNNITGLATICTNNTASISATCVEAQTQLGGRISI